MNVLTILPAVFPIYIIPYVTLLSRTFIESKLTLHSATHINCENVLFLIKIVLIRRADECAKSILSSLLFPTIVLSINSALQFETIFNKPLNKLFCINVMFFSWIVLLLKSLYTSDEALFWISVLFWMMALQLCVIKSNKFILFWINATLLSWIEQCQITS